MMDTVIQKKEFVKMRGPEKPGESGRPKRTPFSLRAYARIHAAGNRMFAKPAVSAGYRRVQEPNERRSLRREQPAFVRVALRRP
jgi:hypothetical protein